jgi:hypothetical protein
MKKFKVIKIDKQEDRTLLYKEVGRWAYYAIAPKDTNIIIGDEIEYEPYGINFGWYKP